MKVVVFGDSIASGQYVSPHLAWVTRMAADLPDHLVMNAGYSGDTTRLGLERMYHDVSAHQPDILIVQFGLNDANIWDGQVRVSFEGFRANLAEIVARAKLARSVLVTNHRTNRTPDYNARARSYNRIIRLVASVNGLSLIDMERLEVPLLDGIHPDPDGHAAYAEAVTPVVAELLR
jgi:lysophospholipase L1-like esterase